MTTPPSPPTPPSPSDSRWHTVGIIVAAVITAAATVTAGLMSADTEKSGPEAAPSSGRTSAPAQSPTPIATPTPTPSAISTPPSAPEPAPTPTPTQPVIRSVGLPPELAGTWVGIATESDSGSNGDSTDSYRVRLELTGGAVTEDIGEVHYEMQGSRCQGDLTLWAVDAVSEALSLGEYIESGNCVKGGRITLTPMPDGTLDFAYTGAKVDGSEQTVHAGLEKVR
ncbi:MULTISPECIES: hypothetical protein [Streptomyces]|uniref:hypothetical protein n=1 Tax=Streptomyces TaxID=1883 RepID=UPI0008E6F548|nr:MULTISPECIES: hypothetical protein [unclassified Streptomyces]UJV43591.1 hypothetical protein CVT30_30465 [Streptomyces sp. AMCC400023]SFM68409.1 hypothetical protein SAMN04487980_100451 [Streptomyces sp. cf124]